MVTDQDVHREGLELLPAAKCVMLGSHPEYVTEAMLDALDAYVEGGGRLMYLGDNGLYWVTRSESAADHGGAEVRNAIVTPPPTA